MAQLLPETHQLLEKSVGEVRQSQGTPTPQSESAEQKSYVQSVMQVVGLAEQRPLLPARQSESLRQWVNCEPPSARQLSGTGRVQRSATQVSVAGR
jgi:hypothetical protein